MNAVHSVRVDRSFYQQERGECLENLFCRNRRRFGSSGAYRSVAPAQAAVGVKAGVLTCNVAGGSGYVFGSDRAVSCTYSGGRGRVEHLFRTISKWGVDMGIHEGA